MKQIGGRIASFFYIVTALSTAILFFTLAVGEHQDEIEGAAQVPHYKADCATALWYSPATQAPSCYDVQTYVVITNRRHKDIDHYTAAVTLPDGKDITVSLADDGSASLRSGNYVAEVWRGKVTRVFIGNQKVLTQDNPTIQACSNEWGIALFVIAGVMALLYVVFGSLLLIRDSRGEN